VGPIPEIALSPALSLAIGLILEARIFRCRILSWDPAGHSPERGGNRPAQANGLGMARW